MKIYKLTSTEADGTPGPFTRDRATDQSRRELTAFFARYGTTINAEEIGFESDRPVFRWATDADIASGAERIVLNT